MIDYAQQAHNLDASCLYTQSDRDKAIFAEYIALLQEWAEAEPKNDKPLVTQCVALQKMRKRAQPEMVPLAKAALQRRETYDAVAYLCRALSAYYEPEIERQELENLQRSLKNEQISNVCNLFRAISEYKQENFREFNRLVDLFRTQKAPNFNPYVAMQASTVRTISSSNFPLKDSIAGVRSQVVQEFPENEAPSTVVSVSSDLRYLEKYAAEFLESMMLSNPSAFIHLAVNGNGVEARQKLELLPFWRKMSERVAISAWQFDRTENLGPISASLRLMHLRDLLHRFSVPVMVLDLDTVVIGDLSELCAEAPEGTDVFVRTLQRVMPWERFTCGFVTVYPTLAGERYATEVKRHLTNTLATDHLQWWVDQNALEGAWRVFAEEGVSCNFSDAYATRDKYMVQPTGKDEVKAMILEKALEDLRRTT